MMMLARVTAILVCGLMPLCAAALELQLPEAAVLEAEETEQFDSLSLPVGPWTDGQIEVYAAEGAVSRQVWVLRNSALTTLQIMAPLRDALGAAGYQILYECEDEVCGGFDFRYTLPLLPEPDMHVDLGDYRYLAAAPELQDSGEFISITVSRGATEGYLHITRIGAPVITEVPTVPVVATTAAPPPEASLTDTLSEGGTVALDDLRFATGSAELEDNAFPSLLELAVWLRDRPERAVILVGHSDDEGALDSNIALSRKRAQSVVERLETAHGIPSGQVTAEGVGFLSPRASNATPEGRAANRRVEVVPISP